MLHFKRSRLERRLFISAGCLLVVCGSFFLGGYLRDFAVYKPAIVRPYHPPRILVLDLDGDGIELDKPRLYGTYYDFDADGQAQQTGWADYQDGVLALDKNGNKAIDGIGELLVSGNAEGFRALSRHSPCFSFLFRDDIINEDDLIFSHLLVWRDGNRDGISQPKELKTLAELDIKSIFTNARNFPDFQISGNTIKQQSSYERMNGVRGLIAEVQFDTNPRHTRNVKNYELVPRTVLMPTLKGHGTLKDLHISQSIDNDESDPYSLLMLNTRLTKKWDFANLLKNWNEAENDVQKLVLHWANADTIDPYSRGPHIDARHLAYYEAFRGEAFRQTGYFKKRFNIAFLGMKNPMPYAARDIKSIYAHHITYYTVHLSMQKLGRSIYKDPYYYLRTGEFSGDLSITPAGFELMKNIAMNADDPDDVWMRVVQIIAYTKNLAEVTPEETESFNQAIESSGKNIRSWPDAIKASEDNYGKIIVTSKDWEFY